MSLFKVELCGLCFCFCFGEFLHIHGGFTNDIGNCCHRFYVFRHRLCERFGGDVHKFGGIHILLELISSDTGLCSGGENIVSISRTLGCHINKSFSGSHSGSGYSSEGCSNNGGGRFASRTKTLEGGTGFVGFFCCAVYLFAELVGSLARIIHTLAGVFNGGVVAFQLTLHTIEGSFCVIKLYLPSLGAFIVFTEGIGGVLKGGTENLDFLLLSLDLFSEDIISGGECFDRFIILVELRLDELHFRAENLKGLVNFSKGILKFLLAFKPYFQTEVICHLTTTFR